MSTTLPLAIPLGILELDCAPEFSQKWQCVNSHGRSNILHELYSVYKDTATDNWDGDGARGVSSETYCAAKDFLKALPPSIQDPEIAVDPDGEIAFDWYGGDKVFSVSVSPCKRLAYSGRYGNSTAYGTMQFKGSRIPEELFPHIRKIFADH